MKNLFGFGPFVGDIETEITIFIPFINWVRKTYNITSKYKYFLVLKLRASIL